MNTNLPIHHCRVNVFCAAVNDRRQRIGLRPSELDSAHIERDQVRGFSDLDRTDLALAVKNPCPPHRRQIQSVARGERLCPVAHPLQEHRLPHFADHARRVVARRSIDSDPDTHRGLSHRHNRCNPRSQGHVRARAVGQARLSRSQFRDVLFTHVYKVRKPRILPQPAKLLHVVDRAGTEALQAELLLVDRLGEVCVQEHVVFVGEPRRFTH